MMNNCKAIQISENIFWVGAVDWSMRNFHGYETSRGSSYNRRKNYAYRYGKD